MNADRLLALWSQRGDLAYDDEGLTQWQHAWQCAQLARRAGAGPAMVLAAWLHDIGHLVSGLEGSPTRVGIDDAHESLGAVLLTPLFGHAVAEPVALHVAAKRYLVATRPGYALTLSPESTRSLALQGGPMSPHEAAAFIARPFARDALRLRAWDDMAKRVELQPPADAIDELEALMQRCLVPGARLRIAA